MFGGVGRMMNIIIWWIVTKW